MAKKLTSKVAIDIFNDFWKKNVSVVSTFHQILLFLN